jgi:hypothetical protein
VLLRALVYRVLAIQDEKGLHSVVYYIPSMVCVGEGTPGRTRTVAFGSGGRRSIH